MSLYIDVGGSTHKFGPKDGLKLQKFVHEQRLEWFKSHLFFSASGVLFVLALAFLITPFCVLALPFGVFWFIFMFREYRTQKRIYIIKYVMES
jgi:hypothetical protein